MISTSGDDTAQQTISRELAEFVSGTDLADIPGGVLEVARQHLLDAIGIAVASSGMDFGRAVQQALAALDNGTGAHVLAFGTAATPAGAALANGVLIHGLDFDDTHISAIYHATAPALAAALAVGEAEAKSGADVLLAYTLGMEIGCRLAAAGAGAFHARGFHPTGIAGTFAAAAVTAKLRGDDIDTIVSALGLCGSQAAGILEVGESWLKRFHPGWAAHAGVTAATFAEAGFLGPATVFEGQRGLYASHLGDAANLDALDLDSLGQRWMTEDIALKPYPCCHFTHAFIDAAGFVLDELGVEMLLADDIETITCPTAPGMMAAVAEPREAKVAPKTLYQSLFSIPYAVALRLVRGGVRLSAFYDEGYDDPAVLAIAAKVNCPRDESADFPAHFPGKITVNLRDGRVITKVVDDSLGTPQRPLDWPAVITKFNGNAQRMLTRSRAESITATVCKLEKLADISVLIAATVPQ